MTNIKFTPALALGLVAALGTAAPALAANPILPVPAIRHSVVRNAIANAR